MGRTTTGLALVATIALAAGCGSSSSTDGASATDDTSPLAAIFGGQESSAESRAKQLRSEEFVAECMNDLGWDYTPVDYAAQFGNEAGAEDADLSPKEYGEKYAYGIVHNYELYELPSISDPNGDKPTEETGPGFVDPNSEFVNSLSPDEQTQYYTDLYGDQSGFATADTVAAATDVAVDETVADTVFTPPPLEEQGCQGQAQKEVYGDSPFNDPEISTRMNELFEDMNNDAGMKAAQRDWSKCMQKVDASWDFPTSNEVYQYFEKRKAELSGQELIETDFDPQTGEPLDSSIDTSQSYSSSYGEDGHGYVIMGQPEALSEDEIERLRKEERSMWEADQKCQKSSKLADAQREAEQKLADTLMDEFPQLKDAQGGGNG